MLALVISNAWFSDLHSVRAHVNFSKYDRSNGLALSQCGNVGPEMLMVEMWGCNGWGLCFGSCSLTRGPKRFVLCSLSGILRKTDRTHAIQQNHVRSARLGLEMGDKSRCLRETLCRDSF